MSDQVQIRCPNCGDPVDVPIRVTNVERDLTVTGGTSALHVSARGSQVHYCDHKTEVTGL